MDTIASPSPSQLKRLRPDHYDTTTYLLSGLGPGWIWRFTIGLPRGNEWVKHAFRYVAPSVCELANFRRYPLSRQAVIQTQG
jgi:hypothetical protein